MTIHYDSTEFDPFQLILVEFYTQNIVINPVEIIIISKNHKRSTNKNKNLNNNIT